MNKYQHKNYYFLDSVKTITNNKDEKKNTNIIC